MSVTLLRGDCLELLPTLEAGIVDAIITDLPYGTTACKWDEVIPFAPMWAEVKRLLKPRGAFVTTASQPFTSKLVNSNIEWFRYCWVWKKSPTGFLNAKKMPMKSTEDVCVFYKAQPTYNPAGLRAINRKRKNEVAKRRRGDLGLSVHNGGRLGEEWVQEFENYPHQVIEFGVEHNGQHPTQKPVALYEYLVKTYTNVGDTVLDFTMGSGTTGVACVQTGRNFIGIEKEENYFKVAEKRIKDAQAQIALPFTIP